MRRLLSRVGIWIGTAISMAALVSMPRWDDTKKAFVGGDVLATTLFGIPSVVTVTGASAWLSASDIRHLNLSLKISGAVTGTTPTLDVLVETSDSSTGATNVRTLAAFAQKTAAGAAGAQDERRTFTGFDDFYRVRWTVAGTTPVFNGVTLTGSGK